VIDGLPLETVCARLEQMPWTTTDTARLRRATRGYRTDTAAAEALGLTRSSLSRYLSGTRKPTGSLAETALRERIERVLRSQKSRVDFSSIKDAEP